MRMLPIIVVAAWPAAAAAQTPDAGAAAEVEDRVAAPADPAEPPAPYSSPMRDECDGLIEADPGWTCELRRPIAADLGLETKGCDAPTTDAAKREACQTELAKDAEWSQYLTTQLQVAICDIEIGKDSDWYFELRQHFDQHMGLETPDSAKPKDSGGEGSPARQKCNELLMTTPKWHASWKAEFEAINAYEFHDRESSYLTLNKKHVFGAYAAFLGLFVVFAVVLFFRQRRLVAEIEQLREDVERAANE